MRSPVLGSAARLAWCRRKQATLAAALILVAATITVVSAAVRAELGAATAAQPGDSATYRFEVTAQSGGASRVVLGHPEQPDLVFLGHGPRVLVVDVSNLATPRVVGRSDPLPAIVEDLAYDSGILYAAFDSGGTADSTGGIAVINVVDPSVPHVHSVFETDVSVRRIAVLDKLVVAAGNVGGHSGWLPGPAQAFLVVDRSDLMSLRETARVLYPEDGIVMSYKQPAGVAVAGGIAFMLRNTIDPERTHVHALDLADPAEPVELGHVAVEGSLCGVLPKSSELLIVAGIWHGGDVALLHSVDNRDPRAMRLSRTIRLDSLSCIRGMRMDSPDGSRVLVTNRCTAQMHAIDASRPGYPEVEATHQLTHPAADVAVGDHGWFVAADDLAGLWTYGALSTGHPDAAGVLDLVGSVYRVATAAGAWYLAHPVGGFMTVASDRANEAVEPNLRVLLPSARDVVVSGSRVYVSGGQEGVVHVFGGAGSLQPNPIATIATGGDPGEMVTVGDDLHIAAGEAGIRRFDTRSGTVAASNDAVKAISIAANPPSVYVNAHNRVVTALDATNLEVKEQSSMGRDAETSALAATDARMYGAWGDYGGRPGLSSQLLCVAADLAAVPDCGSHELLDIVGPYPRRVHAADGRLWIGGSKHIAVALEPIHDDIDVLGSWRSPGSVFDFDVEKGPAEDSYHVVVADGAAGIAEIQVVPVGDPTRQPSATIAPPPTPRPSATPSPPPSIPASQTAYLPVIWRGLHVRSKDARLELTAIVNGPSLDFDWVGDLVYRIEGDQLVVLDVSDPNAFTEIGRSERFDALGLAVDVSGGLAAIAAGEAGVAMVDVAEPRAPRLASRVRLEGQARDVVLSQGHAYVATGLGVEVVDVREPTRPERLPTISLAEGAADIAMHGGYLYVLPVAYEDGGLRVYNLADPTNAVLEEQLENTGERMVLGDTLGILDVGGEYVVIDVADPRMPRCAADCSQWFWPRMQYEAPAIDGSRLHLVGSPIYGEDEPVLATWDMTDPVSPTLLSSIEVLDPTGRAIAPIFSSAHVQDGQLLALSGSMHDWAPVLQAARMIRLDVAVPSEPELIAVETAPIRTRELRRDNDWLYTVDVSEVELQERISLLRYEIVAPGKLQTEGLAPFEHVQDYDVKGDILYGVAPDDDGLMLITYDLSAWPDIRRLGHMRLPEGSGNLALTAGRAFLLATRFAEDSPREISDVSLVEIDVRDPSTPLVVASHDVPAVYWADLAVDGDDAYLVRWGTPGFATVRLAGVDEPRIALVDGVVGEAVSLDNGVAYVASPRRLYTVRADGAEPPRVLDELALDLRDAGSLWPASLAIDDGYAYVAAGDVLAVDVSDPSNMLPVSKLGVPGFYPSPDWFYWRGLTAADGYAYAGSAGEWVLAAVEPSLGFAVMRLRR